MAFAPKEGTNTEDQLPAPVRHMVNKAHPALANIADVETLRSLQVLGFKSRGIDAASKPKKAVIQIDRPNPISMWSFDKPTDPARGESLQAIRRSYVDSITLSPNDFPIIQASETIEPEQLADINRTLRELSGTIKKPLSIDFSAPGERKSDIQYGHTKTPAMVLRMQRDGIFAQTKILLQRILGEDMTIAHSDVAITPDMNKVFARTDAGIYMAANSTATGPQSFTRISHFHAIPGTIQQKLLVNPKDEPVLTAWGNLGNRGLTHQFYSQTV